MMQQIIELTTSTEDLSAIVQRVEGGDEIVLTRAGRPIARLVPEPAGDGQPSELTQEEQARAREAVASIRARASRLNLGPFDFEQFKRDRDEGRR